MPRNHHKLDITQRISLLVRSSWLLFIHTANILVARPYKQRNLLSDVEFMVVSWHERLPSEVRPVRPLSYLDSVD